MRQPRVAPARPRNPLLARLWAPSLPLRAPPLLLETTRLARPFMASWLPFWSASILSALCKLLLIRSLSLRSLQGDAQADKYTTLFCENDIDYSCLRVLKEQNLKELGADQLCSVPHRGLTSLRVRLCQAFRWALASRS